MSKDKISSQEMVEQIAAKLSVSKRVAEEFLKSLFAEIEETLLKGEAVKIKNLGTFKLQWNEPRKSVNVQTGEVITIEGYNKVTFTPDSELKEAVNEPYSHLEPVELDGQEIPSFEIEKPDSIPAEPLRNLNEQASEIRDILSEINALSASKTAENSALIDNTPDIPDYDLVLIDEEEPTIEENKSEIEEPEATPQPEIIEQSQYTEKESEKPYSSANDDEVKIDEPAEEPKVSVTTLVPAQLPLRKKRKGLRIIIGLFITVLIITGGVYIAYFSSSCLRCWIEYDLLSETNRQKISDFKSSFTGWFTGSNTFEKSDSTKVEGSQKITLPEKVTEPEIATEPEQTIDETSVTTEETDSFDIVFKNRRNYSEFLGEEAISDGMRLTNIAQHYYGKKEFWVYIYEANQDNIVHPDRITPGTVVRIPKVDRRLIDKKDPRCLQKAKELHDLYVGKK